MQDNWKLSLGMSGGFGFRDFSVRVGEGSNKSIHINFMAVAENIGRLGAL
jgi:hypothetical protein